MATEYGTQNTICGFRAETTAGTYLAPQATDFNVEVYDLTVPEIDPSMVSLGKPANGTLFEGRQLSGVYKLPFSGKTPLTHSGTAGTAPKVGKLLENAGLVVSGGGASPIVYTYNGAMPCSCLSAVVSNINCGSSPESVDLQVRGIQSNLIIGTEGIGKEVSLAFNFNGAFQNEVDNSTPITTLQNLDTLREKFLETSFTIGSQAFIPLSFSLDLGNQVSYIYDPNKAKGVNKARITGKACKLSVPVYMIDLATSGLDQSLSEDEVFSSITFDMKYYTLEITNSNLVSRKRGDGEGIVTEQLEFQVRGFTLTAKAVV